jgi:hypothetical protein
MTSGQLLLLTQQLSYYATCKMRLFTNNVTLVVGNVLSDFTAASWVSYLDVVLGSMSAAATVAGKAQTAPNVPPVFTNGDVSSKTYYGWLIFDPSGTPTLIGAVNQGLQTLAVGQSVSEAGVLTDTTG